MPILLLFFCSGATALVYEVIWSKYLALMFGSTVQAQTVVLAVFMGGLALGNRLFGGRADRARQPLAIYGYVELVIGLYAFLFPLLHKFADGIFISAGARLLEQPGWLLLLKGVLAVVLLLGPTILMGGTLPLLAAWLNKTGGDAGRRSARFYSTNSLGAVFGAGVAGFYLVQTVGMPSALRISAVVNALIGIAAIFLSRKHGDLPAHAITTTEAAQAETDSKTAQSNLRYGCWLVALTGGISMGLEVLSSRCLSLIFGASLQAFAVVLMAFILGIGLGAAWIASPKRQNQVPHTMVVALLLTAALIVAAVIFHIETLVDIYRHARNGLPQTAGGFREYQILMAVMSVVVLGLPAAALGAVLPLWMRVVSAGTELLGDRVGRLLTWNTVGAVVGVLLTGFVLMPKLGLRGSFGALALVLALAATGIAFQARRKVAGVVALAGVGAVVFTSLHGDDGWRLVLSSGIFRRYDRNIYETALAGRKRDVKILFYEDAADATVSIEKGDVGQPDTHIKLRINGKVDATSHGDLSTQYLLAHLPLLMKPDSKEVMVFGMGSGITAGAALAFPVDHVTVAENCAPVLRAAVFFNPWNRGVLTDPRTRIRSEDARTVLKLNPHPFDVIISEPSNPWMAGVGSVFSQEFYRLAANRLTDGGLMVQWFHVYEMSDDIVQLVLRTFGSVFPHMEIWDASDGDIILIGSQKPWRSEPEVWGRHFTRPDVASALASIGIGSPEALWARQFASQRTAPAIAGAGRIQRDDLPVLEYEAPRALYLDDAALALQEYDERTWQLALMSSTKRIALTGLDQPTLAKVFDPVSGSVNNHLQDVLKARLEGKQFVYRVGGRRMPDVFDPTGAIVPEQYAQVVSVALALGDKPEARRQLFEGLGKEPHDDQLRFLARLMIREGDLPAEEAAKLLKE